MLKSAYIAAGAVAETLGLEVDTDADLNMQFKYLAHHFYHFTMER